MSPADNVPNFDAMTPEEIMAWMESLAKRQGANEGFTTEANLAIPEIDPSTVVIDEPGYVPSEGKSKGKKIESVTSFPKAAAPAEPPPPAPEPIPVAPPAAELPPMPAFEPPTAPPVAELPVEPVELTSISWLESLAADQGGDFPQLDLSSLGADLNAPPPPAAAPASASPIDWLENLAQSQGAQTPAPAEPAAESGDPMAWLESLAKRQGAKGDEFITEADVDVPLPESWATDGPGYTDYSVDSPGVVGKPAELNLPYEPTGVSAGEEAAIDDPSAWLDQLASAQGFGAEARAASAPKPLSDDEISQALARGDVVPHDQMEAWMTRQLEIGAQRDEPEELAGDYDPEAPPVKAELPDWLLEQVGQPAPPEETPAPTTPAVAPLSDLILEPPAVSDMPDWLKEDASVSDDLASIFAPQEPTPPPPATPIPPAPAVSQPAMEIDPSDPWVEAFDMEYNGAISTDEVPDWYAQKTGTVETPSAATAAGAPALQDATLEPEKDIPLGQPESIPDWLQGVTASAAPAGDMPDWLQQEEAPSASDIPDWLKSVDVEAAEIPDWLTETISTGTTEQPVVVVKTEPAAPAAPVYAPPPAAIVPTRSSPAPVPVSAAQIDVAATLSAARSMETSGNLDGSLQNYDLLVRANAQLDAVTADLTRMADKYKSTAAVYRVLGDSLMRQGSLQAALDTYRKALNQL